jgi:NAD-dependent dihydropyrimidine dehydrogenase PreA subunit
MENGAAATARFRHKTVILEQRILIESTCVACGQSEMVCHMDGSILRWEENHRCEARETEKSAS